MPVVGIRYCFRNKDRVFGHMHLSSECPEFTPEPPHEEPLDTKA